MTDVDQATLQRLYRSMVRIRSAEEEVARIYPSDKIKSPVHLSIGQEAAAVGVCDALKPEDVVSGTYRGHATYLAKGGSLNAMMAELYGKVTGCARGKGGSMHLVDMTHNILGSSAVVGSTIPISVGYALALQREGRGRAIAAFFGDGATEEGVFYESLNFAVLKRLPVLFVCENNSYAIHADTRGRWATQDLLARVQSFGIAPRRVGGMDVLQIRSETEIALQAIRSGAGPSFLEIECYRWREHVGPNEDYDQGYRTRAELKPWIENDQILRIGRMLDAKIREGIEQDVRREIAVAAEFAESSPVPPPEELYTHVYAE